MDLNQQHVSVNRLRLLGHRDQVRQSDEFYLRDSVRTQALLVLLEDQLQLLQLHLQYLDVVNVRVSLAL